MVQVARHIELLLASKDPCKAMATRGEVRGTKKVNMQCVCTVPGWRIAQHVPVSASRSII